MQEGKKGSILRVNCAKLAIQKLGPTVSILKGAVNQLSGSLFHWARGTQVLE